MKTIERLSDVPATCRQYRHEDGEYLAVWPTAGQPGAYVTTVSYGFFSPVGHRLESAVLQQYCHNVPWGELADQIAENYRMEMVEAGQTKKVRAAYHPGDVVEKALVYTQVITDAPANQGDGAALDAVLLRLNGYRQAWNPAPVRDGSLWEWAQYLLASEFTARAMDSLGKL